MEQVLVLGKADSDDNSRYIILNGNIVEVGLVFNAGLLPEIDPQWELGEVELSPALQELELGDKAQIVKAQDNPLLNGLELVEGIELEVVLVVDSF